MKAATVMFEHLGCEGSLLCCFRRRRVSTWIKADFHPFASVLAKRKKKYNKKRRKNGWKKYTHKTLLGAALSQLCDFSISMLQNCRPGLLWTGLFSWCGPENLAPGQWGQSLQHSSLFLPHFFFYYLSISLSRFEQQPTLIFLFFSSEVLRPFKCLQGFEWVTGDEADWEESFSHDQARQVNSLMMQRRRKESQYVRKNRAYVRKEKKQKTEVKCLTF